MRCLLALSLACLLSPLVNAQEEPKEKGKGVVPIKIIELNRKDAVVYEKEVEPIFYKKCVTCHSGSVKEARFDVSTYEGLVKGGKRGTAIVPGKKAESNIYKFCKRDVKPYMPPRGEEPLSPEELALIGLWIDQGAKAPTMSRPKPKIVVSLPPASVQPVRAVAISPDKTIVAASRANQIHLYEGVKGEYLKSLIDPGLKLADGKGVKAAHLSLVESLAFSPDGKFLVSGSFQEISIWDPKTGQHLHKITGFAHEIVALAFTADGKLLATGGGAPTEEGEVKFFQVGTWKLTGEIKNGHSDTVYGLCFSPDPLEIVNDKKEKIKLPLMIATCSADKFVKVWDVATGKFVKSFEGHTHHVLDVGWSADGKLLASAGADNTVKVWDFEKGEQARTINAHGKQVTRLMFLGKKSEILTCSGDGQVKMFNVTNGGNVKTFAGGTDFIFAIGASPDGALVASGGQEGIVRLYNGTTGALVRALLPPDAQPPMKTEDKKEKKDTTKKK